MVCSTIKPNINKICEANFNRKIKIQFTSSAANNSPDVNAGTTFKDLKTVWAMIKTKVTGQFIDNINTERSSTIDFYIRWTASIDFEKEIWVEYNSKRYKIETIDNIDEQNKTVKLSAIERGKKSIQANQR